MIGAVVAMDVEAEALLQKLDMKNASSVNGKTIYHGTAFGKDILLVVCGVGKVNAAVGACTAIAAGANLIFNFGVAGGLNGNTKVAQIYLIEKAVQYDFDLTQLNGTKIGTLDEYDDNYLPLLVPDLPFERRALGSGDRFNDSPKDHSLLTTELKADIRDMEGAAIAQVCKAAGVPVVSIKAISDVYGSRSTTEQYLKYRERAVRALGEQMETIIGALS